MALSNAEKAGRGDFPSLEIHLRTIDQLFNSLDPAPFHERDLDADAEEFLVSWAAELPRHQSLHLVLHLENEPDNRHSVAWVANAIRHYFDGRANMTLLRLRRLLRKGRITLAIGMLFLFTCLLLAQGLAGIGSDSLWRGALKESLGIGGWVAMWQPLQIYLYDWWPIREQYSLYRRMAAMSVEIAQIQTVQGGLIQVRSRESSQP